MLMSCAPSYKLMTRPTSQKSYSIFRPRNKSMFDQQFRPLLQEITLTYTGIDEQLHLFLDGYVAGDGLSTLLHEFTHYWYCRSPVYRALDVLKIRSLLDF